MLHVRIDCKQKMVISGLQLCRWNDWYLLQGHEAGAIEDGSLAGSIVCDGAKEVN